MPKLSCDKCNFVCQSKELLDCHTCDDQGNAHYHCKACDFHTDGIAPIRYHLRKHIYGALLRCEHCQYKTRTQENLDNHLLRHRLRAKNQKNKCVYCNMYFIELGDLRRHVVTTAHIVNIVLSLESEKQN